jgi:hypothetical protein
VGGSGEDEGASLVFELKNCLQGATMIKTRHAPTCLERRAVGSTPSSSSEAATRTAGKAG